jgi:hypothetical protein
MVFVISTLLLAIADRTTGEAKGSDH